MRRKDKIKNMERVNILFEERNLKEGVDDFIDSGTGKKYDKKTVDAWIKAYQGRMSVKNRKDYVVIFKRLGLKTNDYKKQKLVTNFKLKNKGNGFYMGESDIDGYKVEVSIEPMDHCVGYSTNWYVNGVHAYSTNECGDRIGGIKLNIDSYANLAIDSYKDDNF